MNALNVPLGNIAAPTIRLLAYPARKASSYDGESDLGCALSCFIVLRSSTEYLLDFAGTFSSASSSAECVTCSAGSWQPSTGASTCALCEKDNTSSAESNTSSACSDCPAGTELLRWNLSIYFQPRAWNSAQQTCERDGGQIASIGSSDENDYLTSLILTSTEYLLTGLWIGLKKPAGSDWSWNDQSQSTYTNWIGYFSNYDQDTCAVVNAENRNGYGPVGSWFVDDCNYSAYGFVCEGKPESTSCVPCGNGKYSDLGSVYTCFLCPAGSWSNTGASVCDSCPSGTYSDEGGTKCTSCSAGTWQSAIGSSSCSHCEAGKYSTVEGATESDCAICPSGTYSLKESSSCSKCLAGSWQSGMGSSNCENCATGTYSTSFGAISSSDCQDCEPGTYSPPWSLSINFEPTTWSDAQHRCSDYGGQLATIESRAENDYLAQLISSSYGSAYGLWIGLSYQGGYDSTTNSTLAGWRWEDQSSLIFPDWNVWYCEQCCLWYNYRCAVVVATNGYSEAPLGSWFNDGCSYPGYGFVCKFNTGASACAICPAGTYSDASGASICAACEAGSHSSANASTCTDCSPGHYSSAPELEYCLECEAGTFASSSASTACENCDVRSGLFSPIAASACESCGAGKFVQQYHLEIFYIPKSWYDAMLNCEDHRGQLVTVQSADMNDYLLEFISEPTAEVNVPRVWIGYNCPSYPWGPWMWADGSGSNFTNLGNSTPTENSTSNECAFLVGHNDFTFTDAGSWESEDCNLRLPYVCEFSQSDSCSPCSVGTYSSSGGSHCNDCAAGTFTNMSEQSSCMSCDPGEFSSSSKASQCSVCPEGSWQPSKGSSCCTFCESGKFSTVSGATDSSACHACDAGKFSIRGSCIDCPAGTYTSAEGMYTCPLCEAGKYASAKGSSQCSECGPGEYSVNQTVYTGSVSWDEAAKSCFGLGGKIANISSTTELHDLTNLITKHLSAII